MTPTEIRQQAYQILGIVQEYAPNLDAQNRVSALFNTSEASGGDPLVTMANVLADGLNHGNWPWHISDTRKLRSVEG